MAKKKKKREPIIDQPDKQLVHVLVPTMGDVVGLAVSTFLSSLDRISLDPASPYKFIWSVCHGKSPVEYARNFLVSQFLANNAEIAWFLDSDMIPPANALDLLSIDADIIAPSAFAFNHTDPRAGVAPGLKLCVFKYNMNGSNSYHQVVPKDPTQRVLEVDGAGTAGMAIRRHVLTDKRMWLEDRYMDIDHAPKRLADEVDSEDYAPPIFRTRRKPNGAVIRGEDLDFCYRAKSLGYTIKADMGVKYGHIKSINTSDVAAFAEDIVRRMLANQRTPPNLENEPNVDQVDGQARAAAEGGGIRRESEREIRAVPHRPWSSNYLAP